MREIKFRAWNQKINIWHDRELTSVCGNGEIDFAGATMTGVTLEFYTGLKDKNGKEVYEGDIDSLGRVVVFKDGAFHFEYPNQNSQSDVLTQKRCDYIEIIGNIHEHPELLGDKIEV